ncbi:MAG: redox-regulated ATPase YchF [Phycisphaerales bacterium]|jgi:ribosome-binding ATPase|nr:redox-regulated ATPase YchF [Phycisphaerales bacterium]
MRVALIGPPQSGKSTLFQAIAAGSGSGVDMSRPDQPHLATVKVPDERLTWLSEQFNPKKTTPAELAFLDMPGFDLTGDAGRQRAKVHWASMRQSDMLVFVVREFKNDAVAMYRDRVDPAADVEEMLTEMIFADLEQVTNRLAKLEASLKKPVGNKDEIKREMELMTRLVDTLEEERPISDALTSEIEIKMVASFAFLSQKPVLIVLNCDEDAMSADNPTEFAGRPCMYLSAQIEEELAELPAEERGEFLADLGLESTAGDRLIRACYTGVDLVSFLTSGEDECRAWTIRAGTTAVDAAGEIHSDIARGFIRAETVAYDDFKAGGDMKGAKAAGKVRLEGKTYVVQDGDIINYRFNV